MYSTQTDSCVDDYKNLWIIKSLHVNHTGFIEGLPSAKEMCLCRQETLSSHAVKFHGGPIWQQGYWPSESCLHSSVKTLTCKNNKPQHSICWQNTSKMGQHAASLISPGTFRLLLFGVTLETADNSYSPFHYTCSFSVVCAYTRNNKEDKDTLWFNCFNPFKKINIKKVKEKEKTHIARFLTTTTNHNI